MADFAFAFLRRLDMPGPHSADWNMIVPTQLQRSTSGDVHVACADLAHAYTMTKINGHNY